MFDFNRLLNALSARAGTTARFQRMLEWKLLRGSHEFPGPDGGTCVNEAAVVAAGYPYRAIYRAKDLPASFSRPIAMFALCLNDTLGDELRQELLMPFVTRLARQDQSARGAVLTFRLRAPLPDAQPRTTSAWLRSSVWRPHPCRWRLPAFRSQLPRRG